MSKTHLTDSANQGPSVASTIYTKLENLSYVSVLSNVDVVTPSFSSTLSTNMSSLIMSVEPPNTLLPPDAVPVIPSSLLKSTKPTTMSLLTQSSEPAYGSETATTASASSYKNSKQTAISDSIDASFVSVNITEGILSSIYPKSAILNIVSVSVPKESPLLFTRKSAGMDLTPKILYSSSSEGPSIIPTPANPYAKTKHDVTSLDFASKISTSVFTSLKSTSESASANNVAEIVSVSDDKITFTIASEAPATEDNESVSTKQFISKTERPISVPSTTLQTSFPPPNAPFSTKTVPILTTVVVESVPRYPYYGIVNLLSIGIQVKLHVNIKDDTFKQNIIKGKKTIHLPVFYPQCIHVYASCQDILCIS